MYKILFLMAASTAALTSVTARPAAAADLGIQGVAPANRGPFVVVRNRGATPSPACSIFLFSRVKPTESWIGEDHAEIPTLPPGGMHWLVLESHQRMLEDKTFLTWVYLPFDDNPSDNIHVHTHTVVPQHFNVRLDTLTVIRKEELGGDEPYLKITPARSSSGIEFSTPVLGYNISNADGPLRVDRFAFWPFHQPTDRTLNFTVRGYDEDGPLDSNDYIGRSTFSMSPNQAMLNLAGSEAQIIDGRWWYLGSVVTLNLKSSNGHYRVTARVASQ